MPTAEQRFVSFPNKYGPYVDTVGKNENRIAECIENRLKEDEMGEQLTMSQYGSFTGGKQRSYAAGRPYLRV